ncbi:MAG: hypothetical protein ACE5ER_06160 [Nitrospinaceae bacterium]
MALLDLVSLAGCAWLLIRRLGGVTCPAEHLALAVLGAMLLKAMEVFLLLGAGAGLTPSLQAVLSVGALAAASSLLMATGRTVAYAEPPPFRRASPRFLWQISIAVTILFGLSMTAAMTFPITAPDGIWYQIRAWDMLHGESLEAPHVLASYAQYPPLVPFLLAWLQACGCAAPKVIFPVAYLCLVLVVFGRVRDLSGSEPLAGLCALLLASTPYFWWHSTLGLLNLIGGVFFAVGGLYWYSLVRAMGAGPEPSPPLWTWAVLSGVGFGAAAWTRPEFILYTGVGLVLLMAVRTRWAVPAASAKKVIWGFFLPALGLPTLWNAVLLFGDNPLGREVQGVMLVTLLWWGSLVLYLRGYFKARPGDLLGLVLAAAAAAVALVFAAPESPLSPFQAMGMGLYRTLAFHVFFFATAGLGVFAVTLRWKHLPFPERALGLFLGLYLGLHAAFYMVLPQWSPGAVQFFDTPFIYPGDAVNSPDTREYLAWYPLFICWVACLPKVRRAFDA